MSKFWADTADIAQVLLGALVELMLHQPREHCGHDRWTKFQLWSVLFSFNFFLPQSALKHSFLGAESSNFAMNGPKNLSKSLYQKDRPFRAILDFAEKFQIFGILRLSNKFEDLKISSHFILLLNTSSKTICRKKIFGPISVEICCPEKMALKFYLWMIFNQFEGNISFTNIISWFTFSYLAKHLTYCL